MRQEWNNLSILGRISTIGAIVGILSFGFYLIEKGFLISKYFPWNSQEIHASFRFDNTNSEEISLKAIGKVVFFDGDLQLRMENKTFEILKVGDQKERKGYYNLPPNSMFQAEIRIPITEQIVENLQHGLVYGKLFFNKGVIVQKPPSIGTFYSDYKGFLTREECLDISCDYGLISFETY